MTPIISVEKTAITNGIAKSAKDLFAELSHGSSVLDYGAGKLRNTIFLNNYFKVDVIDTPIQCKDMIHSNHIFTHAINLPLSNYEGVLCSYVLNVIPEQIERDSVILSILAALKDNGIAWIEVRKPEGILKSKYLEKYNDGFLVGNSKIRTFQKGYNKSELEIYLNQFNCNVLQVESSSDSVIAKIQKDNVKKEGFDYANWSDQLSLCI